MTAAELLRQAKALIADERNWWDGIPIAHRHRQALCASEAMQRVTATNWCPLAWQSLRAACGGQTGAVIRFNDHHTHPEVMAAFDKAIELAERQEAA